MRIRFLIILLFVSITSYGQISIDTTSVFIHDSITKSSTDWSVYLGGNDSSATLVFDTITKSDFQKYKKRYHTKIDKDSLKLTWTDTSFTIKTGQGNITYNTRITDDFPFHDYQGFLEPLNLFVVSFTDGRNEYGTLLLIDGKTGKTYYFTSPYDYPCHAAVISPKNNYLLSYANNWYEHNQSYISILKVDRNKKKYRLKGFIDYNSAGWTVNEIVWINENSFVLSVKEKTDMENYDPENGTDYYLKATIKNEYPVAEKN